VNRERNEFDQIGVGGRIRIGSRQRLAFLQKTLSLVLHGVRDHQAGIGEIEALRNGSGKIEGFRDHHFASLTREEKANVVTKHMPIILLSE
jgi:hypothetical protein